jgi:hypothetical protein
LRLSEQAGVTLGEHGLFADVIVVFVLFLDALGRLPRILPANKGGFLSSPALTAVLEGFTMLLLLLIPAEILSGSLEIL